MAKITTKVSKKNHLFQKCQTSTIINDLEILRLIQAKKFIYENALEIIKLILSWCLSVVRI